MNEKLIQAVSHNNIKDAKKLLKKGAPSSEIFK